MRHLTDRGDRNQTETTRLLERLVTECTQCRSEVRVLDAAYEESGAMRGAILCPKCRRPPKKPEHIAARV